jgi:CRP-like cAMP-binding protein
VGQEIHPLGEVASHVYFPINGLISMIATMVDGASVEIGVAGREGMLGVPSLLADDGPSQRAIVQLPGTALRLPTRALRQAMLADPPMQRILLRYVQAVFNAAGQSAACNRLHRLDQRCARWLLAAHDRVDGDTFPLTHDFLAMMLGAHRPGVTLAAQSLQSGGLISYSHGIVSILNRGGLEAACCECHDAVRDGYDWALRSEPEQLRPTKSENIATVAGEITGRRGSSEMGQEELDQHEQGQRRVDARNPFEE